MSSSTNALFLGLRTWKMVPLGVYRWKLPSLYSSAWVRFVGSSILKRVFNFFPYNDINNDNSRPVFFSELTIQQQQQQQQHLLAFPRVDGITDYNIGYVKVKGKTEKKEKKITFIMVNNNNNNG